MKPHPYLVPLIKTYRDHADPVAAVAMKAYMREKFDYFGISTPERRKLSAVFFKENGFPEDKELSRVVKSAYDQAFRELHYFALELLLKRKAALRSAHLPVLKKLILQHSWWDTIDFISPKLVGFLVANDSELSEVMDQWAIDKNIWIRRSAILHQMKWKQKTDFERLSRYCMLNADSKEFFIQKAMGWALREYAYIDPKAVSRFVAANKLPNLTIREATKHIH